MGFVLSKVLPALLFPVSLTCLLCLAAGILALRRKATGAAILTFSAGGLLYLASTPFVSWPLVHGLESQYSEPEFYPKVSAIVVLGGAMIPDALPRRHPGINENGERLLQAARLWRAGLAPKLVATGGAIPLISGYHKPESDLYARSLVELFEVPGDVILQVSTSRNTLEDAVHAARLFDSLGMKKEILLVTNALHMPRSVLLFRKQGFRVFPAPAGYRFGARFYMRPIQLIPDEVCLKKTADALHEYAGLVTYKLMGRL